MGERAYLDHNATTPLDPRVLEAMLPYLREHYGNASSVHTEGRLARQAVEQAREQVAALVAAHPSQVIFTSGGTEANNLALKGVSLAEPQIRLAVSAVEHASVLAPAKRLGGEILPVDEQGRLQMAALEAGLAKGLGLVSVMLVNNETGVIEELDAIAQRTREHGAILHTDAVQAAGKIAIDISALGVQLLSLSAHKIYGPKGIGALVVDKAVSFEPLLDGGGHERGRRAGTLDVPAIVGFGKAAELAVQELESRNWGMQALRERLEQALTSATPGVEFFSRQAPRVSNTCFFSVPGIDGEALLLALDEQGYAVSSGSACDSKNSGPSHVLTAMGIEAATARGAIRVGLGKDSTPEQVDGLVAAVKAVTDRLGRLASPW
jgi:cysteine desulfurase